MKSHRYVTLLATASLILAATAQGQANPPAGSSSGASTRPSASTSSPQSMSPSSSTSTAAIGRVSKDSVKDRFTARDLIGASVYDRAGERIGDISDIDLFGTAPGSLAMAYNQGQKSDKSVTKPTSAGTATTSTPSATTPSSTPPSAGSDSYAHSGSSTSASSNVNRSTSGATSSNDPLRDSSRPLSGIPSAMSQATVFVSVGGLWGVGDDLVSVPFSQLSYNSSEERFELAAAKADIVALAEGKERTGSYAATPSSSDMRNPSAPSTSAAKQTFGDEASKLQAALRADPMLSSFAQNVMVSSDGDTLKISGSVDTKEHKKLILDSAKRSTSLKINDELNVRE